MPEALIRGDLGRDAAPRHAVADLLLAATRRFCEQERPSREEADLYREAFYSSVQRLDTATRQTVATLLSHTPYCPRPIALFLAMDVPAVAHSMLRRSAVLAERDLEQIIARATPIHVRLLATRPHLSDALIERIAAFDDADIHTALLANTTLALDDTLRERLSPRQAGPLRRTVTSSPGTASPHTTGTVEARLREALANTAPRTAARKRRASMDAERFRTVFEAAAMKRDRKAMVEAMQARFGLKHGTAVQALDDRTGDALQVMMKADGFDAAAANRCVMLAIPAVGLSPAATERALQVWGRLKVETCRSALAQWPREEGDPSARHEPLHQDAEGVRRVEGRIATGTVQREVERRFG